MKKTLNKQHREEIAISMVKAATAKGAKKVIDKITGLRNEIKQLFINAANETLHGISGARQLDLLQKGVLHKLNLHYTTVRRGEDKSSSTFTEFEWSVPHKETEVRRLNDEVGSLLCHSWPGHNTIWRSHALSGSSPDFRIEGSFPDVAYAGTANSFSVATDTGEFGKKIIELDAKAVALFIELKEVMDQGIALYVDTLMLLGTFTNNVKLAEALPETVEHFPDSLTLPKPAKEVLDPRFINDIRAKLAKGIPI